MSSGKCCVPIPKPQESKDEAAPMRGGDLARGEDLALVQSIRAGSVEAWHDFVERYSGIIYSVLRRYFHDEDEIRDGYVDVLNELYQGLLEQYAGRSALSTWLVFVARSHAIDTLRRRHGRRELPTAVKAMGDLERQVFQLYYLEGASFDTVRRQSAPSGDSLSTEKLIEILGRIEESLDRRSRRRIAYDLHAPSVGAASGRILEFLDQATEEYQNRCRRLDPDFVLMEKETRATVARVRALIATLPAQEQRILSLRFDAGRSARQIAEELQLGGQRQAYTAIDRALRRLRKWLNINVVFFLMGR